MPMGTEHFDEKASTWDEDPEKVTRAQVVAARIRDRVPLTSQSRILEYGAGTGLVAQALRTDISPVLTLADNSAGMRKVMADKLAAGLLGEAQIWDLDLEKTDAPDASTFDLVIASMVLHHVKDLPRVLRSFHHLLAPGGRVALADLDAEQGDFHDHDFDGHHGFDRSELAAQLQTAGFDGIAIQDCDSIMKEGREYPIFLAVAQRGQE